MKKRYIATAVGTLSTGLIAGYLLFDKDRRTKLKEKYENYKSKFTSDNSFEHHSILDEAGIPDQLSNGDTQIENANMVSEGSQYGVSYYNEVQEENQKVEH